MTEVARKFVDMGFKLVATAGTADVLESAGMTVERVYKVKEGRPNAVDLIKGERIHLIVNTPHGVDPWFDETGDSEGGGHGPDSDHHDAFGGSRGCGRDRVFATWRSATFKHCSSCMRSVQ